jgi:hypothetical protein
LRDWVGFRCNHPPPYYRQAIGDVGDGDIDLRQLPILTKTTLMAAFDRIVTDRRLRLEECAIRRLASAACPRAW